MRILPKKLIDADCDPIIDEDDIPSFTSVDDILNRSLNLYDDVI